MIVGATGSPTRRSSGPERLYDVHRPARLLHGLQPHPERPPGLPTEPELVREHRLYQADWLLRFMSSR